jgi:hypothetical protein
MPIRPRVFEFHAIIGRQYTDSVRLDANLESDLRMIEIIRTDIAARCTKAFDGQPNAIRVFFRWPDSNIEIPRCSRISLRRHRMSTDNEEISADLG